MGDVKHTPGPWTVTEHALSDGEIQTRITFGEGRPLAVVDRWVNCRANAQRIVACVNACEGLNPEALQELVAAANNALSHQDVPYWMGNSLLRLRAAVDHFTQKDGA